MVKTETPKPKKEKKLTEVEKKVKSGIKLNKHKSKTDFMADKAAEKAKAAKVAKFKKELDKEEKVKK